MANVTLSIKDSLIKKGRKHAKKRGKTLNGLIRELLSKEIEHKNADWLEHCFSLMDKAKINSKGIVWSREELHER
jgi:hypothetical protein